MQTFTAMVLIVNCWFSLKSAAEIQVTAMLVYRTKDCIVTIFFSLYTNMAVIASLQTKNYFYNITWQGRDTDVLLKKGYFLSPVVYMVDIQPYGEWILTVQLDNHKITMAKTHTFAQRQTIRKQGSSMGDWI